MSHAPVGTPCNCGARGWLPGIEHVETAAQGGYGVVSGKMVAKAIVAHTIEGWQSTMIEWAQQRPVINQASYHFTVGRHGRKIQHVSVFTPAWHAGRRDDGAPPQWALNDPSKNLGGYTVSISGEGTTETAWTEPMIVSFIEIAGWVRDQHGIVPSIHTLIKHSQLNPKTRSDPGPRWPQDRIIKALSIAPPPQEVEDMDPGYTLVREGETLSKVAQRTGIPLARIVELNGIPDPNKVSLGQPLRLYDHLWQPPLFGYSNAPSKPDLTAVKAQVGVIKRAVEIADNEIAKVEGGAK